MRDDLFKIIRLDELRIPKCKMDSLVGWLMMVMVMIKGTFVLIHIMQIMERINYYCHFFSLHSTLDQQQ